MSWEKVKLADLCSVITKGTTPSNIGASFTSIGINYIRSEMVTASKYISSTGMLYISRETHEKLKRSQLQVGDILFSMAGVYLGKTAILRYEDVPANTNQAVALIRTVPEKCYREYIYYFLNSPNIIKSVNTITSQSAQPNINLTQIGNIEIVLPPIETQKKIADILSAYDDLIENNQKQIKLLEEAAQRLYKEWFVDLHFPGYESTPIIDGIPQGWKEQPIMEICKKINAGGTPSRRNKDYWDAPTIKWYKTQELQDCWLIDSDEKISIEGQKNSSAKFFPKDSILMAIYASPTLGRLGILDSDATSNQAALCLQVDETKVSWQWLYEKLYELRDHFNGIARGAGQQNISGEVVKQTIILCPTQETMQQYTKLVAPYFEKRRALQKQNIALKETRDRLLPKLMNGEIEVGMDKQETVKIDKFENIRKHWQNVPYDEDLPLAARSTGDISEETLEKLKEIAEEE